MMASLNRLPRKGDRPSFIEEGVVTRSALMEVIFCRSFTRSPASVMPSSSNGHGERGREGG